MYTTTSSEGGIPAGGEDVDKELPKVMAVYLAAAVKARTPAVPASRNVAGNGAGHLQIRHR